VQLKSLTPAACRLLLVAWALVLEPSKMAREYLLHWHAGSPAHAINPKLTITPKKKTQQ